MKPFLENAIDLVMSLTFDLSDIENFFSNDDSHDDCFACAKFIAISSFRGGISLDGRQDGRPENISPTPSPPIVGGGAKREWKRRAT